MAKHSKCILSFIGAGDYDFKGAVSLIFSVTMNSPKTYLFEWNR